ncbi:MAG: viscotoxin-A3, partial [Eggerthellaceae bacterium]|nr:viscotoxin-A3 [Eggerthellaceae bacterium]
GALLLPPVWGAGHGMMATILFYPAWLFADNCFYAAWSNPTPLSVAVAIVVLVTLTAITVGFAIVSQPMAAHRAEARGVDRATYLARERRWAVGCALGGIVLLALATWYNLAIRPTVGA